MKQRKLFTLVLVLVLVVAMGTSVFAASFTDVNNHWAKKYIVWAADPERKLVEGYGDNTFQPNGKITKAEFYKMVNRFANYTAKKDVHYTDVKSNDWFYNEVSYGIAAGYLSDGYGSLSPNQAITRDEAARIVAYVYDLTGNSTSVNRFKDSNSIVNKGAVGALVDKRVINGYPEDNTYKPNGTLTRAEFSKILYTAVDNIGYPKAKVLGDYTVTFDANGGYFTGNETKRVVNVFKDNKVTQPVNPSRSGYTFDGWYTTSSSTGGTKFNFDTKITSNTTLYARWTTKGDYTVTFDANGGYFDNNTSTKYKYVGVNRNDRVSAPYQPRKYNNATFLGWYTSSTGGTKFDFDTRITSNTRLYAHWSDEHYYDRHTVTFYRNDGSGDVYTTRRAYNGDSLGNEFPSKPSRANYEFKGWYTSGGTAYDKYTKIYGNTSLYAKWGYIGTPTTEYTLTVKNGQDNTTIKTRTLEVGQTTSISAPAVMHPSSPAGKTYVFDKWTAPAGTIANANANNSVFTMPAKDVTVTANYKEADKAIEFHNKNLPFPQEQKFDLKGNLKLKNVELSDVDFSITGKNSSLTKMVGTVLWVGEDETADTFTVKASLKGTSTINDTMTIHVRKYKKISYVYETNDGRVNNFFSKGLPGESYDFIVIPEENKEIKEVSASYDLNGVPKDVQVTNAGSTNKYTFTMPNADVTVKVIFKEKEAPKYAVTFNANGGSFTGSEPTKKVDVVKDNKVSQPENPTRSGYTFDSWYTSASGGTKFDFNTKITSDTTLYAHWTEKVEEYTITLEPVGGTLNGPNTIRTSGQRIGQPADPTPPENLKFLGWYPNQSAPAGSKIDFTKAFTGDTTIYAAYKK